MDVEILRNKHSKITSVILKKDELILDITNFISTVSVDVNPDSQQVFLVMKPNLITVKMLEDKGD